MVKVSGFDLSMASTGWAVTDCLKWETGTLRCPIKRPFGISKTDIDASYTGKVVDWYRYEFLSHLKHHQPDYVGIEKPLTTVFTKYKEEVDTEALFAGQSVKRKRQDTSNFATLHILHAITATLCGVCSRYNTPVLFVAQQKWRSDFGVKFPTKGCQDRSKHFKVEARRICTQLNIPVKSNDAAEACGVASFTMEKINPNKMRRANDLFASSVSA